MRIDRFVVLRRLGAGAMGVVFAAYDERLDRKLAIKLLASECSGIEGERRLLREAQAMARLAHPNVVVVHEVGMHEGQVFLAMEFIEGPTLRAWMATPRRWQDVVGCFIEAGRGLEAAHANGLVHRDFKPDNVIVGSDGRTRVLDFGLARHVEDDGPHDASTDAPTATESLMRTDGIAGTPAYLAPELLAGQRPDARSDQFCFCVALYEGLHGERPFAGSSIEALFAATAGGEIRAAPSDARVPAWLRRAVLRGLSPDPAARWPSMSALLTELGRDRARARGRWMGGAAVLGVIGVAGAIALREPSPIAPRCEGTLAGTWDEPRRAAVRSALLSTSLPYAPEISMQVESLLDAYADAWLSEHDDTCEAFHVRASQSSQLFDLRMACLDRRQQELKALTDLLVDADDATTERAVQAVGELRRVSTCADVEALLAALPLPDDATARAQVEGLRVALDHARALHATGKYDQGLASAEDVVTAARALGHGPTTAEALLVAATLQAAAGEAVAAEARLLEAVTAAAEASHDEVAANAWTLLAHVVGVLEDRYTDGLAWSRVAEAMVIRAGNDPHMRATLWHTEGDILREQGHAARALARYEQASEAEASRTSPDPLLLADLAAGSSAALADDAQFDRAMTAQLEALDLRERTLAPGHPAVAITHDELGTLLVMQGKYAEAREHIMRGLEVALALGPRHPVVARIRVHLGTFLHAQGEHEAGLAHLRAALVLEEERLGGEHPSTARTRMQIGTSLHRQGDYAGALLHHRRGLADLERHLGADHPDVGAALDLVGMDLAALDQPEEALVLFRRALAIMESRLVPMHPNIGFALSHIASALYLLGRVEEALEHDLRALAIAEHSFGADHADLIMLHYNIGLSFSELAIAREDTGHFRSAREHLERALAIAEASLEPDHPSSCST